MTAGRKKLRATESIMAWFWRETSRMFQHITRFTATHGLPLPFWTSSFVSAFFFLASPVALAQSAGTLAPVGSMITPRDAYTATLLPNGKVLIAGGYSPPSSLASAELYDPLSGFSPAR